MKLEENKKLNKLLKENPEKFFTRVKANLDELLPILYTPTVGAVAQRYSEFEQDPSDVIISFAQKDQMAEILQEAIKVRGLTKKDKLIVVVTDGSAVLGLGDQGVGGIEIVKAKGLLYTIFADIEQKHILPVMLDCGTNNQKLLDNRNYRGLAHSRINEADYLAFIDQFVQILKNDLEQEVLLHWEDFSQDHAMLLLEKYRAEIESFNDDIEGTALVTVHELLSACQKAKISLSEQKIAIYGAGVAGCGIADLICKSMQQEGLSEQEVLNRIYLIDKNGLLTKGQKLFPWQEKFAKEKDIKADDYTVLIGCTGCAGLFDETMIKNMAKRVKRPIIFVLSNPNKLAEATPNDLINWTDGRAIIATGSPFDSVEYQGEKFVIPQCNNAKAFPGIGKKFMVGKGLVINDENL